MYRCIVLCLLVLFCVCSSSKSQENKTSYNVESKIQNKINNAAPLLFLEEFKTILEKHLFGYCPQSSYTFKQMSQSPKAKNATTSTCEMDNDAELSGRLASLALRAHSASRSNECWRLGSALANMLGELARTAAQTHASAVSASNAEAKKRKLSKSQKAKIQAKQKTALAVKKKAAAAAAGRITS